MIETPVTTALRNLRKSAGVGLREMARRLGVSQNTYGHYENPERFKDPYLPMHMAKRFADALEPDGVPRDAILALAGAGSNEPLTTVGLDARLAGLSEDRRHKVLLYLAEQEALHALEKPQPNLDSDTEDP